MRRRGRKRFWWRGEANMAYEQTEQEEEMKTSGEREIKHEKKRS